MYGSIYVIVKVEGSFKIAHRFQHVSVSESAHPNFWTGLLFILDSNFLNRLTKMERISGPFVYAFLCKKLHDRLFTLRLVFRAGFRKGIRG